VGEADARRITSTMEMPGAKAPQQKPMQVPVPVQVRQADSLSRPYVLPSRGVHYDAHDGSMVISPTRGAQEEILAGARGDHTAATAALLNVTQQCFEMHGLPFNGMLLLDWTAAMIHFLALSAGDDTMRFEATHRVCGKTAPYQIPMTALPCTVLRIADDGERVQLAELPAGEEEALLREMDAAEREAAGEVVSPITERVLTQDQAQEPFSTQPLPHTGEVVAFRHLRVQDLVNAEQFAATTGDRDANNPQGKLHTFLLASQIVTINGRKVGRLESTQWVRNQPSPVLDKFREEIRAREFGYDVRPRVTCKACGGPFRAKIPLDGRLFRRRDVS
jgi:hypothetical protein